MIFWQFNDTSMNCNIMTKKGPWGFLKCDKRCRFRRRSWCLIHGYWGSIWKHWKCLVSRFLTSIFQFYRARLCQEYFLLNINSYCIFQTISYQHVNEQLVFLHNYKRISWIINLKKCLAVFCKLPKLERPCPQVYVIDEDFNVL